MEINSNIDRVYIENLPDLCPFCHIAITPTPLFGYEKNDLQLEVLMCCPNKKCKCSFIGYYVAEGPEHKRFTYAEFTSTGTLKDKTFSEHIEDVSSSFISIFNQAWKAEQHGLVDICGVGYRKAFEFLVKDYAITKHPSKRAEIQEARLYKCIEEYMQDERIKSVAKRTTWLGNDETHYVRRWENKDVSDLRKLIDLTIHWIEMEKLTEAFEDDMPE